MHELAIAEGIADVVTQRAHELHAARVTSVRLRIGEASGIVSEALSFSFAALAREEPILAGATLVIDKVPHRAHCRVCDQTFDVQDFIALCPLCGTWSGEILSGTELQVIEMEIARPEQAHAETAPSEAGEEGRAP